MIPSIKCHAICRLLPDSKDKSDVAHVLLKIKSPRRKDVFCILNKDISKSERRDRKSEGKRNERRIAHLIGPRRLSSPEWAARSEGEHLLVKYR